MPVPESKSRLVLAHNSEAPGPRVHTVFVSSVAFHCFVLAVITSCFKMASERATWSNYVQTVHSHLSGTQGVN